MLTYKYAGPPGTGKSTALLDVLDKLLASGVSSEDIVFTTFTRAGANEAKERAIKRFNIPPARLPYFKTLHALCFGQIETGLSVMTVADWCEIAKKIGVFFSVRASEEGVPQGSTKGDAMLTLWSISRVLMEPIEKVYQNKDEYVRKNISLTLLELQHFIDTVKSYKSSYSKMDYTDMLELFISRGNPVGASHIIVDEAQDLSPLQWAVVNKLKHGAKELHIAGDDDQAIHEWNGASPHYFIKHASDEFKVLPQSYRIPASVHKKAMAVVSKIKTRLPKVYQPRAEEGQVLRANSLNDAEISKLFETEESWFLLVRNHSLGTLFANFCREKGLLYTGSAGGIDPKILTSIKAWDELKQGKPVSRAALCDMYSLMSTRDRVAYGSKSVLLKAKEAALTHEELVKGFGLTAPKTMTWQSALDRMPDHDKAYLEAAQKRGPLSRAARIEIATIHAVKGREADNVVILPDMTMQTYNAYLERPDQEHRVWYVGVTRAKKRLVVLSPISKNHYDL